MVVIRTRMVGELKQRRVDTKTMSNDVVHTTQQRTRQCATTTDDVGELCGDVTGSVVALSTAAVDESVYFVVSLNYTEFTCNHYRPNKIVREETPGTVTPPDRSPRKQGLKLAYTIVEKGTGKGGSYSEGA